MTAVKIQTSKQATWINANGDVVPFKFVPKASVKTEALAAKVHKSAVGIEQALKTFHDAISAATDEAKQLMKEEYEIKTKKEKKLGKGAFTWYNFDKSLKIEAQINDIVSWDHALLTEALGLFNSYISGTMSEVNELVKQLVNDAFSSRKGMFDSRKIFQLLKYEDKIKHKSFQAACQLIKKAQAIDKTKLYMRVWEKMPSGEYRNINLNFSSI